MLTSPLKKLLIVSVLMQTLIVLDCNSFTVSKWGRKAKNKTVHGDWTNYAGLSPGNDCITAPRLSWYSWYL